MKIIRCLLLSLAACALLPAAPALSQRDPIWDHAINNDTNGVWNVQPERPRPRDVEAPDYLGGAALRVQARQGANPWTTQARSPIQGAINQGDVVMLMFYARAEVPAEGGSSLPVMIQLGGAPYTTVLAHTQPIDGEWKQYCVNGVASSSINAGDGIVGIHLATATQTVDLGPVFVFNFGPNYDRSSLPTCQ